MKTTIPSITKPSERYIPAREKHEDGYIRREDKGEFANVVYVPTYAVMTDLELFEDIVAASVRFTRTSI